MKQIQARILLVTMLLCAGLSSPAQQTVATNTNVVVPPLVNYSGVLTDGNGKPLTEITGVTFFLYKDQQGGAPLWMETQNVQPDSHGHYRVMLGSTTSAGLPAEIFTSGEAHWLGVQVQGQEEQPRVLLVAVPYALKAGDAETLGGRPASAFLTASSPTASDATASPTSATSTPSAAAAALTGSGTTNYLPKWTSSSNLGVSKIFQSTSGDIGIGTTTPSTTLDVNGRTLVTGGSSTAFGLTVSAPAQLGAEIEGPISGVGAGLDLATTGTGGKQWEILATGNTSSQGVGKFNIRDVNSATDVLTIDTTDTVNIAALSVPGNLNAQVFQGAFGMFGSLGMISEGPVGVGSQFATKAPKANLDVQGSSLDTYIGDPQCGANPFAGIGFGTSGLKNCENYSMVGDGANTYIGAPTGNIYFRTNSNATTPLLMTPAGSVGIGTAAPNALLDIRGNAGNSGFGIAADHSAWQAPSASGWIKAMAFVDPYAPGGIAVTRCYNSQQAGSAVSTPPCGIAVLDHSEGNNIIDFGFEVDNRFVTTTAVLSLPAATHYDNEGIVLFAVGSNLDFESLGVSCCVGPTSTQVIVDTYDVQSSSAGNNGLVDVPFFVVVY